MHDIEKHEQTTYVSSISASPSRDSDSAEINAGVQATRFSTTGPLARLRHYEALLDKKLGVEGYGPDHILLEARNPPIIWMMAALWASGTLSCFATGFPGWDFGLKSVPINTHYGFWNPFGRNGNRVVCNNGTQSKFEDKTTRTDIFLF